MNKVRLKSFKMKKAREFFHSIRRFYFFSTIASRYMRLNQTCEKRRNKNRKITDCPFRLRWEWGNETTKKTVNIHVVIHISFNQFSFLVRETEIQSEWHRIIESTTNKEPSYLYSCTTTVTIQYNTRKCGSHEKSCLTRPLNNESRAGVEGAVFNGLFLPNYRILSF